MKEFAKKVNIRQPSSADEVDIKQDPFHPNAYVISLQLDEVPSYAWQTLFEREMWYSLDFWERKVLVVGDQLKLLTTSDNFQDKLDWLEQIVVATNRQIDQYNANVKAVEDSKQLSPSDIAGIRTELSRWLVRRETGLA
jgi:hypothetical protein